VVFVYEITKKLIHFNRRTLCMSIFINYTVRSMIKKKKDEIVPIFINNPLKNKYENFKILKRQTMLLFLCPC